MKADDKSEAAMKKNVEGAKFVIAIISDRRRRAQRLLRVAVLPGKELRWAKAAGTYIQPIVDSTDKSRIGEFLGMAPADGRTFGSGTSSTRPDRRRFLLTRRHAVLKKAGDATATHQAA